MKTKPWTMLLMMLTGWTIGAAWWTAEILQEDRLMARMSISTLLGVAFSRKKWHKTALKEFDCYGNDNCNIAEFIVQEMLSDAER